MTNIRDVSKLAGVSVATVSRALANPETVSEKSRQKVFEAIKEIGYEPNILARNFRTKKTQMIVVLVPDIANPFFSSVIRGIEQTARINGYSVLLGDTQGNSEREAFYANMVNTKQTDGIIQLSANMPFPDYDPNADTPLPMVNACECMDDSNIPTIQLDNEAAAKTMTEHLLSLGHKKIGVIMGPETSPLTKKRLRGYKQALKSARIKLCTTLITSGDFSIDSGFEAAKKLLSAKQKPTALFCFNDEMAIGAMRYARNVGIRVPQDISIAGFDDIKFSAYCTPSLTTISQPTKEFGRVAMQALYELLQGRDLAEKHQILPYKLIVRNSTGPAPK